MLTAANAIYRERTKQPLPLVVCTDAKMPPGITVVSNLSEKELATWYYHATCFIFPSLIEGFGFPPLEAMQHLTPVIAADTPIQHEILGDACLYFNPHDPGDLADKIEMLSANPLLAEKLLKAGQGICKKYDWKVSGQEIWKIIKGLTSD